MYTALHVQNTGIDLFPVGGDLPCLPGRCRRCYSQFTAAENAGASQVVQEPAQGPNKGHELS